MLWLFLSSKDIGTFHPHIYCNSGPERENLREGIHTDGACGETCL